MTESLAELEERVRSGDETVTAEEIEHARSLARFAELRTEAAERRAAEDQAAEAARDRAARIAEARRLLDGHGLGDVAEAYAAAREALHALVEACDARTGAVGQAARLLATTPGVTARWDGSPKNAVVEFAPGDRHTALMPGPVLRDLVGRVAESRPDGMPLEASVSLARRLERPRTRTPLDDVLARTEG
ncbi:hypothetical protein [Streptomyces parvulus]|uniref:hypothetical protein n=1 Tax=Streptomyces parvulus TaxID=146923 RepID=UPI0033EBD4AF